MRALERAADHSGIEAAAVVARLTTSDDGLRLLASSLAAAADAALTEQVDAIGAALASGAVDEATIDRELLFVRSVGDLETAHVRVLTALTRTSNELGLGDPDKPEFDDPVSSLNEHQIALAMPDLADVVDPILATLVRHGLVGNLTSGGGAFFGGGGQQISTYAITEFGRHCLRRLTPRL